MHKHSLIAFDSIKESQNAKLKVLRVIKENPKITRQEIANILGWEINRVTGRVSELKESGKVKECGRVIVNNRPRALLEAA